MFVLGGSWSGPKDLHKDAELYDATLGTWTLLPGIQAAFILTDDPEDKEKGTYRADNYGWFFPWTDGTGVPTSTLYRTLYTMFDPQFCSVINIACVRKGKKVLRFLYMVTHLHF